MTREEAIKIINRENDPNDKKVWEVFPEYREALEMAIQALSQEPTVTSTDESGVMYYPQVEGFTPTVVSQEQKMTLDEAIIHAGEVADSRCDKCGEEHRQLVEWLKDYKRLLEQQPKSPCDLCRYDYMDDYCGECPAMARGEWE